MNKSAIDIIKRCEVKALADEALSCEEAVALINLDHAYIYDLIAAANRVRRAYKGDEISLCSIVNAKSGRCPEDCAFCPQSVHSASDAPVYDLMPLDKIMKCAGDARKNGAEKFGLVTSGYGITSPGVELESILTVIRNIGGIHLCASLGVINREVAGLLKEAGLREYHHNLETARSYFPNICSTHDYEEDVESLLAAKSAGLRVCAGGIFGVGESPEHRVELAFTLRELDVDTVPLNFLNPIRGTKLENAPPLRPFEILKIVAVYRMVMPSKDIKVAGGREKNLRDLQCLMFAAGANSAMTGNYLTTTGRPPEEDIMMIRDLELVVKGMGG